MERRAYLAAVAGGTAASAGCATLPRLETTTPAPVTDGSVVQSGEGDYRHRIIVDNSLQRAVTLTIAVEREDALLYRETHTVAAGTQRTVAGIDRESLPEGSRGLTVAATSSQEASAGVEVNVTDCLGSVVFYFDSAGELQATYSIC
jgi:hypothetical protein